MFGGDFSDSKENVALAESYNTGVYMIGTYDAFDSR